MENPQNQVLEVVIFRMKANADLSKINQVLEPVHMFMSAQKGFEKWLHGSDEKGNYLDLVYWRSLADAQAAAAKAMESVQCQPYFSLIDEGKTQFFHFGELMAFEGVRLTS